MDCSEDRAIAEKLEKQEEQDRQKSFLFFKEQIFKMNTQAAAKYEKNLLDSKTRQQYHDDNMKDVRVALWAQGQKNKPY